MTTPVVVIGGNLEGIQAAIDIADSGIDVTLIEQTTSLGTGADGGFIYTRPKLLEATTHPNIRVLTGTDVTRIERRDDCFRLQISQRPRYVKTDSCTSCGRCERACPVNLLSLETGDLHKAIHRPALGLKSAPATCVIDKTGLAPCNAACPAGINVQGYVALISQGKLREALELIREAVPFPHILGRVCTHPCESACTRGKVDQPIAIASLKRYLADMEPAQYSLMATEEIPPSTSGKVAIIGSGPAGLTCARDLRRMGYAPTVFESLPVAGGMVAVGMPRFRLPREVREAEISNLFKSGIEIRTNTPIGKDLTLSDLFDQGYRAIFVAIGAHKNPNLDIPGEDLEGVIDSIAFLRSINLKQPVNIGNNVVVIGGGYTAIDSARTAIRLHCKTVRILYRRTTDEMSATNAEILETIEEGVDVSLLVAPTRIIGENGKVVGIECRSMELGEPDRSGRRRPVPIEGSEFIINCDTVIPAIGQLPDLDIFSHDTRIQIEHNRKTLTADPLTLSTNVPGIFAGGDVVYGPESMVEAVAAGRRAAVSIDRYINGEDMEAGRTIQRPVPVEVDLEAVKIPPGGRRRIPTLPIRKRVKNFEEVETGYTTFMALRESKRCLNCGGCSECMECVTACELEAVDHSMEYREDELHSTTVVWAADPQSITLPEPPDENGANGLYVTQPAPAEADIRRRLMHASAIAGRVTTDLIRQFPDRGISHPAITPAQGMTTEIPCSKGEPRIGVFVCQCGGNISEVIDTLKLVRHFYKRSGISYSHEIGYACSDDGASQIQEFVDQYNLSHVVLAACACCSLDQICFSCSDRRMECKAKLLEPARTKGITYEFVNIREHCSWVHPNEPENALKKAKSLVSAGIARVRDSQPLEKKALDVRQTVVVLGGGLSGLQAAANLATQGFQTTLISDHETTNDETETRLMGELREQGVNILQETCLHDIRGTIGAYTVIVERQTETLSLNAGTIVVDISATGSSSLPNVFDKGVSIGRFRLDQTTSRIPGIFLCGTRLARSDRAEALAQGSAAAAKASALLRKGKVALTQTVSRVDPRVCRGCGTCASICEFGAASLVEGPSGYVASVSQDICRGCGTCVAHCPSGAIDQDGLSDNQLASALEAMLSIG